jgi:hypothetical protein
VYIFGGKNAILQQLRDKRRRSVLSLLRNTDGAAIRLTQAQAGAPHAPVPNKKRPVVWILTGCFGLIVIAGLIALGTGMFVPHRADQAGLDPDLTSRNPGVAVAKMLAGVNPGVEVVPVNEDKGLITLRERSTGKTVSMNFEDVKNGKIGFKGEDGEEATRRGEGDSFAIRTQDGVVKATGTWNLPGWIPVYTGATVSSDANSRSPTEDAGAGYLDTTDSIEKVLNFYEGTFKNQGIQVTRNVYSPDGQSNVGTFVAQRTGGKTYVNMNVVPDESATIIHITYSVKK